MRRRHASSNRSSTNTLANCDCGSTDTGADGNRCSADSSANGNGSAAHTRANCDSGAPDQGTNANCGSTNRDRGQKSADCYTRTRCRRTCKTEQRRRTRCCSEPKGRRCGGRKGIYRQLPEMPW